MYAQFATQEEAVRHYYNNGVLGDSKSGWLWVESFNDLDVVRWKHYLFGDNNPTAVLTSWREQIEGCAWRQQLKGELDIFLSGPTEGCTVTTGMFQLAVEFGHCDSVAAFIPHLEELNPLQFGRLIKRIPGPEILPVLDLILDLQPLTPWCIEALTKDWLLPHTILRLMALPHEEIVRHALTTAYPFLCDHGICFDQPGYILELCSEGPYPAIARLRFVFERTQVDEAILTVAKLAGLHVLLVEGEERARLRPKLQEVARTCLRVSDFHRAIVPGDWPSLSYGTLLSRALVYTRDDDAIAAYVRGLGKDIFDEWAASISNCTNDTWKVATRRYSLRLFECIRRQFHDEV